MPILLFSNKHSKAMAELGQYMDDVYRFWDSKTMHVVSLQRLNMMIEIYDRVLDIYQDLLL